MEQQTYLVRRQLEGNGSALYLMTTFQPEHGEEYFKGKFRPRTIKYGQLQDKTATVYDPEGTYTVCIYDDGQTETMADSGTTPYMVREQIDSSDSAMYYRKSWSPKDGDVLYFGKFRRRSVRYGQHRDKETTV